MVLLASQDLPQDAAHDLAGSRLGKIRNHKDGLGSGKRTNRLPDLKDEILLGLFTRAVALLERDESVDSLAGKLVVDTNDSSLGDGVYFLVSVLVFLLNWSLLTVLDKGSLDLSG